MQNGIRALAGAVCSAEDYYWVLGLQGIDALKFMLVAVELEVMIMDSRSSGGLGFSHLIRI